MTGVISVINKNLQSDITKSSLLWRFMEIHTYSFFSLSFWCGYFYI